MAPEVYSRQERWVIMFESNRAKLPRSEDIATIRVHIDEVGYPAVIVGYNAGLVNSVMPDLPSRESDISLCLLISTWLGMTCAETPNYHLLLVLTACRNVLHEKLLFGPTSWVGLPQDLSGPIPARLTLEFGQLRFIYGVLLACAHALLLYRYNNSQELSLLYCEAEALYVQVEQTLTQCPTTS